MLTKDTEKIQEHREIEAIEKTHEMLVDADKQNEYREAMPLTPDADMDVTDAEQRMGRPMHVKAVMKLLAKANRNFHFEVSISDPSKMGIYLLAQHKLPGMAKMEDKMFICGMENGMMPEYSLMEAEVQAIPDAECDDGVRYVNRFKKETRGWKTVLATLLRKRLISSAYCDRFFNTELGTGSQRWDEFSHTPIEMIGEQIEKGDTHGGAEETRDSGVLIAEW